MKAEKGSITENIVNIIENIKKNTSIQSGVVKNTKTHQPKEIQRERIKKKKKNSLKKRAIRESNHLFFQGKNMD